MTEAQPPAEMIRAEIISVCRRLYDRNCLAGSDGNVSYRLSDEEILFTPSGRQKAFIREDDIAVTDLSGKARAGRPSGEQAMHLHIFRSCPGARAIIHAHPPHAVAFTLARPELKELPCDAFSEVILGLGSIPIAPYARPTTTDMGDVLGSYLPKHRAIILARHGAVCWGETLEEALNGMERVEHASHMLWLAETLGGAKPLGEAELTALREMRARMGERLL